MTKAATPEWANLKPGTLIEFCVRGELRRARTLLPMYRSGRNRFSYTLLPADGYSVPAKIVRPVFPVAD
jgi:hypothetical protein